MRNSDATRQRILDAAFSLLAEGGFQALGVNEVARRAQCDKKLIYRYFGRMEGLVSAMGEAAAAELTGALSTPGSAPARDYADLMATLALKLYRFFADSPRYRLIRLLEASAPGPLTDSFRAARGRAIREWLASHRAGLVPPVTIDASAVNAVMIAAVEGLAIFGAAGLDPDDPATAARIEAALGRIAAAAYAAG